MSDKEEFERWFKSAKPHVSLEVCTSEHSPRCSCGHYIYEEAKTAWAAWQASRQPLLADMQVAVEASELRGRVQGVALSAAKLLRYELDHDQFLKESGLTLGDLVTHQVDEYDAEPIRLALTKATQSQEG